MAGKIWQSDRFKTQRISVSTQRERTDIGADAIQFVPTARKTGGQANPLGHFAGQAAPSLEK